MMETWTHTAILILLGTLLVGSTLVWDALWRRSSLGLTLLPAREQPTAPVPLPVLLGVIGWLTFNLSGRMFLPAGDRQITLSGVQMMLGINLTIAVLLPVALTEGFQRNLAECGLTGAELHRQMRLGSLAFLAAVWPTGVLLAISSPWRSVETQHEYLAALRESPGWEWIFWIAVTGVIGAPLAEELLFRVVLQGWLSERLPGAWAIGVTAAVFALIHGWRDALPLLPFSLIIGYMYYQTRWYWACVATHALFNGAMLTLALLSLASQSEGTPAHIPAGIIHGSRKNGAECPEGARSASEAKWSIALACAF